MVAASSTTHSYLRFIACTVVASSPGQKKKRPGDEARVLWLLTSSHLCAHCIKIFWINSALCPQSCLKVSSLLSTAVGGIFL